MKSKFAGLLKVFVIVILFNAIGVFGGYLKAAIPVDYSSPVDSVDTASQLKLNLIIIDSRGLVRVSFQGDEGNNGTLKFLNSSNRVVYEVGIELIKLPYYTTIDVTDFYRGSYSVVLTTEKTIHTTSLIIK